MSFGVLGEHGRGVTEHFGVNVSSKLVFALQSLQINAFIIAKIKKIASLLQLLLLLFSTKCSCLLALRQHCIECCAKVKKN